MKISKWDEMRMLLGLAGIFFYAAADEFFLDKPRGVYRGLFGTFREFFYSHFGGYSLVLIFAGLGLLLLVFAFNLWRK